MYVTKGKSIGIGRRRLNGLKKLDIFHLTTIGRKLQPSGEMPEIGSVPGRMDFFLDNFKIIGGKCVLLGSGPEIYVD